VTAAPALVIDNFYRDPDCVREIALGLHYLPPTGKHPGPLAMLSPSMEPTLAFLYEHLAQTRSGVADAHRPM
jgi:hypothetical protein